MIQLYYTALESGICALLLAPIFLILNKTHFHSNKSAFISFLFAVYLTGIYAVVGVPNVGYIRFEPNLNLIPFQDMRSDIRGMILNVLLFVPLGLFLYLLFPSFRHYRNIILIGAGTSLCIELLQLFTYRATDINDIITNTVGAVLGYTAGISIVKTGLVTLKCRNPWTDFPMIAALSFSTMFLLQPVIWYLIY